MAKVARQRGKDTRAERVGTIAKGSPRAKARQEKGPKGTAKGKARDLSTVTAITVGHGATG